MAKSTKTSKPIEYATAESVSELTQAVGALAEIVKERLAAMAPPVVNSKPAVAVHPKSEVSPDNGEEEEGGSNDAPINPNWVKRAKAILGDFMESCEVFYPTGGGTIFTVIVKAEKSNASKEYLERMKVDRRSKEVSAEGIAGVDKWCKIIKQNLARGREVREKN